MASPSKPKKAVVPPHVHIEGFYRRVAWLNGVLAGLAGFAIILTIISLVGYRYMGNHCGAQSSTNCRGQGRYVAYAAEWAAVGLVATGGSLLLNLKVVQHGSGLQKKLNRR